MQNAQLNNKKHVSGSCEECMDLACCNKEDKFPSILCLFPVVLGLIFGVVFCFQKSIQGNLAVKLGFGIGGFVISIIGIVWICMGIPIFREYGCYQGLQNLQHLICGCAPKDEKKAITSSAYPQTSPDPYM